LVELVLGEDELVGRWVFAHWGATPPDTARAIGVAKDGKLIGGVAYTNFNGASIEMHCAGKPGWLTRQRIKVFFRYPFNNLNCKVVVAPVYRKNKEARRVIEGLGWKRPYRVPGYFRDDDLILYSMLKAECKWIKE